MSPHPHVHAAVACRSFDRLHQRRQLMRLQLKTAVPRATRLSQEQVQLDVRLLPVPVLVLSGGWEAEHEQSSMGYGGWMGPKLPLSAISSKKKRMPLVTLVVEIAVSVRTSADAVGARAIAKTANNDALLERPTLILTSAARIQLLDAGDVRQRGSPLVVVQKVEG